MACRAATLMVWRDSAPEQEKQSTDLPQRSRSGKAKPCCPTAGQPADSTATRRCSLLMGSWAWMQASTVAGGRHSVVTDYMLRLLVSLLQRLLLSLLPSSAGASAGEPAGEPLLVSLCW